jgi:hypothetical protein
MARTRVRIGPLRPNIFRRRALLALGSWVTKARSVTITFEAWTQNVEQVGRVMI